jgi:hypothetical protein
MQRSKSNILGKAPFGKIKSFQGYFDFVSRGQSQLQAYLLTVPGEAHRLCLRLKQSNSE